MIKYFTNTNILKSNGATIQNKKALLFAVVSIIYLILMNSGIPQYGTISLESNIQQGYDIFDEKIDIYKGTYNNFPIVIQDIDNDNKTDSINAGDKGLLKKIHAEKNKRLIHNQENKTRIYQFSLSLAAIIIFGGTIFCFWNYRRYRKLINQKDTNLSIELNNYSIIKEAYDNIIGSKKKLEEEKSDLLHEINLLKNRISDYENSSCDYTVNRIDKEKSLLIGDAVAKFINFASHPKVTPTIKDWQILRTWVEMHLPTFYDTLHPDGICIRQDEYDLAILVRLSFRPLEIANLMHTSKSNVSTMRRRLYMKISKKKGHAKDFDYFVRNIH